MGAWIETVISDGKINNAKSHPVWVRGLKLLYGDVGDGQKVSHPVWVRGLKQIYYVLHQCLCFVAPCMGAWIET